MPAGTESFDISEELKKLPDSPGVYLMRDGSDEIIYVGKAVSLRKRVRQYFRESTAKSAKIEKMVSRIARFEYIMTDSELEALILECNLIKEHRPKYNTMLKDDKTYPYVKVTLKEDFPRLIITRRVVRDGAKYFGPFTSAWAVRETVGLLRKMYRIRGCQKSLSEDSPGGLSDDARKDESGLSESAFTKNGALKSAAADRACLNYHIGQCDAPCAGGISKESYRENVMKAVSFLEGNVAGVIDELEEKMQKASEAMEYEEALKYRDLIQNIRHVTGSQKITSDRFEDRDIIACAQDGSDAVAQVFFVRGGKLIGREHFYLTAAPGDTKSDILTSFIKQYYAGTPFIPSEILVQEQVEDTELLIRWLTRNRGGKVNILHPQKGKKEKLIELAKRNAENLLVQNKERYQREQKRTQGAVREIEMCLGLDGIKRMEAYDISNISGYASTGSMIVYEEGRPKRNNYRKFKIKTVKGADDYASLYEVLTRRFTHGIEERKKIELSGGDVNTGSFTNFPDLILMDGGKGQVNTALRALKELDLNIPVCGMVKDDSHRTRGLYFHNEEIPIDPRSEGFRLITRIQDEAHRFAIEYHRNLRSAAQVRSVLDDIDGIGPARRKALMRYFKTIDRIREAEVSELKEAPSMNARAAQSVYDFFH